MHGGVHAVLFGRREVVGGGGEVVGGGGEVVQLVLCDFLGAEDAHGFHVHGADSSEECFFEVVLDEVF